MNNVNKQGLENFIKEIENDVDVAKKTKSITGSWVFEEGKSQFVSTLEYPNGKSVISSELPSFMGGWGNSPDPVQYCLYGLGACFAATIATNATQEGIEITKLEITVENTMDLGKMLGLSDENIIKGVKIIVDAEGPSTDQIEKLIELAQERCPGVECTTRSIPLDIETNK